MTVHTTAVYEGGLLRPMTPLPLEEGAQVEVIVLGPPQGVSAASAADILADIAALSVTSGDPFTSRDHNRVLYSENVSEGLRREGRIAGSFYGPVKGS